MNTRLYFRIQCVPITAFFSISFLLFTLSSLILAPNSYAGSIVLSWDASTEPGVAGYRLYVGPATRNYEAGIDVGDTTTHTFSPPPESSAYFAVTAYTSEGLESEFSDEVLYQPPAAPSDIDGDGVEDSTDGCPVDPAKAAPGQCGCGNPDIDTDGDGMADCIDNCPAASNPDQADTDNDGIGDSCDTAGSGENNGAEGSGGIGGSSGGGGGGGGGSSAGDTTDTLPDTSTGCTSDTDCGGTLFCNTGSGQCVQCLADAQCDDGLYCNGTESCVNNQCRSGDSPCSQTERCDEEKAVCTPQNDSSECSTDAACNDGVFCNGEEVCLAGECVSGDQPCGEGQECSEDQQACLDIIKISSANVVNTPRRPVVLDKRYQWLVVQYAGNINLESPQTTIAIEGPDEYFHGIELSAESRCFKIGTFIFIPVCISRDATAGKWTIIIQTEGNAAPDPSIKRMETRFQIN